MQIRHLIAIVGIGLFAVGLVISAFTGQAGESERKQLQQLSGMEASDFRFQWENYPPPHEAQVKTLLEGAKAQAQSAGQIIITDAKLKTFSTNGSLEMIAQTPKCVLDSVQRTVSSSSALQIQSTDGRFFLEGEGFFLSQTNSNFTVSNRVHTILRSIPGNELMP